MSKLNITMDLGYTWILWTGEKLPLIKVTNINLIYLSVLSSDCTIWDGAEGVNGGFIILAYCEFPFIGEHENLK